MVEVHTGKALDSYARAITEADGLPENFKTAFKGNVYRLEGFRGEYSASVSASVTRFRAGIARTKLDSKAWLAEYARDAYLAAKEVIGEFEVVSKRRSAQEGADLE